MISIFDTDHLLQLNSLHLISLNSKVISQWNSTLDMTYFKVMSPWNLPLILLNSKVISPKTLYHLILRWYQINSNIKKTNFY